MTDTIDARLVLLYDGGTVITVRCTATRNPDGDTYAVDAWCRRPDIVLVQHADGRIWGLAGVAADPHDHKFRHTFRLGAPE
jgi:hypothetical protein